MSDGGTLIERFVVQELHDSVRSILESAFDERMRSKSVLLRGYRGQTTFSAKSIQVFNFFVMFH